MVSNGESSETSTTQNQNSLQKSVSRSTTPTNTTDDNSAILVHDESTTTLTTTNAPHSQQEKAAPGATEETSKVRQTGAIGAAEPTATATETKDSSHQQTVPVVRESDPSVPKAPNTSSNGPTVSSDQVASDRDSIDVVAKRGPLQEEKTNDRQDAKPQTLLKPSPNAATKVTPKPVIDGQSKVASTKIGVPGSRPTSKVAVVSNKQQITKQPSAPTTTSSQTTRPHLPVAASAVLETEKPRSESTSNPSVQQQRSPLVQQYGPYVHPSDTSVADARRRLRTALEQTRRLRSAFTDRVFEKYLVELQPVPPNIDGSLQKIEANPAAAYRQLEQDIRWIRDEKDFEKIEAQKFQAAGNTLERGSSGIASTDTVDQLEWFGAGLNLVLLPENQSSRPEIHRISAAAATAADMMLDRVRRAGVLRAESARRRQAKPATGSVAAPLPSKEPSISRLHLLTPTVSAPNRSFTSSTRGRRKSSSTSTATSKPTKKQPSLAGSALLSLNPALAEETQPLGREKRSAATSALIAEGVGLSNSARAITNRVRSHPFPDSVAGRRASLQTGRRVDVPTLGSSVPGLEHLAEYGVLDLPPVALGKSKKVRKLEQADDVAVASSSEAVASIRTVLSQFAAGRARSGNDNESKPEKDSPIAPGGASKRKRIATEIGLMRSMRQTDGDATPKVSAGEKRDGRPIEPSVSFSVLHALGLLSDAPNKRKEPRSRVSTRLGTLDPGKFLPLQQVDRAKLNANVQRLKAVSSRLNSKKRPFSEAFVAQSNEIVEQAITRESGVKPNRSIAEDSSKTARDSSKDGTKRAAVPVVASSSNVVTSSSEAVGGKTNGVPALPLRGGGEDEGADPASNPDPSRSNATNPPHEKSAPKEEKGSAAMRVDGVKSEPHSPARELGPPKRASSSHLPDGSASRGRSTAVAAFSPTRNEIQATSRMGHDAAAIIAQRSVAQAMAAERYHAATSPLHSLHGHSIIPGMYSSLHHPAAQGASFGGRSDWGHLEAASGISPLSAMSIDPHRAALMGLTARDRATRAAILAREQHHNAAVAAAVHRAGVPVGLSPQAAFLMGSSPAAASMLHRGTQHFPALGAQSAAAAAALSLSSSAALMSSRPSSSSSAIAAAAKMSGSRPSSSSGKSSRAKPPSSVEPRLAKRESTSKPSESPADVSKISGPEQKKQRVAGVSPPSSTGGQGAFSNQAPSDSKKASQNAETSRPQESKKDTQLPVPQATKSEMKLKKPSVTLPSSVPTVTTGGMKYFEPPVPARLDSVVAQHVKEGRFHEALGKTKEISKDKGAALLEYLLAVGSAVPIPKALVANPLKERLNSVPFKSSANATGSLSIPREPIVATILVWLWMQHQESFQRAFAKSGRIDVDPECKFLIQAAIEASSRAIASELADLSRKGGPMANALGIGKLKGMISSTTLKGSELTADPSPSQVDLHIAGTTSTALMTEVCIDDNMDLTLPLFGDLAQYLDESRLVALRLKCRERALLAAIVLRASTMSEQFSHAYVGSMVRAGEALGHGDLFELLQDESTATSSMIPFDIFSDDVGAWEDPCRPLATGYTPELTGADLIRRAHARAMIQKSLRKMQERSSIRGGATNAGPYSEPTTDSNKEGQHAQPQVHAPSRGRKRASQSLPRDATRNPGTGFAPATKMSLYNPSHQSTPLIIDTQTTENSPYGKHIPGPKQRAFSVTRIQLERRGGGKRGRKQAPLESPIQVHDPPGYSGPPRSTHEVDWTDVAEIFKVLGQVESKAPRRGRREHVSQHPSPRPQGGSRTIIAPFCRRITDKDLPPNDSDDSDVDAEDVTDQAVLSRHCVVLDEMKVKLDKLMESRQTVPARARARSHSTSGTNKQE